MLNVVNFPEKASRFRKGGTPRSTGGAAVDISNLVSLAIGLQSKARTELRDAILLLDLAAQRARHLVRTIRDPVLKKHLDDDLQVIEELLQLARDKTMQL